MISTVLGKYIRTSLSAACLMMVIACGGGGSAGEPSNNSALLTAELSQSNNAQIVTNGSSLVDLASALPASGSGAGVTTDNEQTQQPSITNGGSTATTGSSGSNVDLSTIFSGSVKAFPGAEGFGTDTIGGRGGVVCAVTNLNDSGSGSFRSCIEQPNPRIVIFRVSGTITVQTGLLVTNPFISIFGQTAPGDGIMVRGAPNTTMTPFRILTHDVVVQHMRFRVGNSTQSSVNRDAASIDGNQPGGVYNVVMDHISFSWGIDEIMSIWYDVHDVTVSRSIISEGLWDSGSMPSGPAGRGFIVGSAGAHSISLHHNFFAHSYQRNPLVKISGIADVVNNLVYHWISYGAAVSSDYDVQKVNFVKNKYIALTNQSNSTQNSSLGWGDFVFYKRDYGMEVYFEGNIGHNRPTDTGPEWSIANSFYETPYDPALGYHTDTRHPAPAITETPVSQLETVLIQNVGATLPRQDAVDQRLFSEMNSRSGRLINCVSQTDRPEARCDINAGGWPVYNSTAAPADSDGDGIPDEAEIRFGFNINVDDAAQDLNNDGYTNIEHWVHSIGL